MIDHRNIDLNAWVYMEGIDGPLSGTKMRLNELQADMGGYTSELLAKAADQQGLDEPYSPDDQELLLDYLISWGLISADDLTYQGTSRRGYAVPPGVGEQGVPSDPYAFNELLPFATAALASSGGYLASVASHTWQTTLVKLANGVGQLFTEGFANALGDRVRLNAEVMEIRQDENEVRIVFMDRTTGETEQVTGDFCVCNIPLSVLINIPGDFSADMREAMQSVPYAMSGRMGMSFRRRFWEEDDWIYGGQSFTNIPEIGILAYPDNDYFAAKGVLLGYYNFGNTAAAVSALSLQERTELALEHGSKIHSQYRDEFESAFSVAWHRMPYALGAWPSFTVRVRQQYYPRLLEPDGRVYLVGEHLSYVNSWMEGAFQSAWVQTEKLHQRAMQSS